MPNKFKIYIAAMTFALTVVFAVPLHTYAVPRFLNRMAPEPSTQRIQATDGAICGSLVFIPKGKGPHPTILILHSGGSRSTGAIGAFRRYGAVFAPLGYGIVALDYRLGAIGGDALYDVSGALEFVERHERLDRTRVVIVGESQGAYLAALAASRESIYAIICSSGFYNLAKYMREELSDARSPAQKTLYQLTVQELGEPLEGSDGAYSPRSPALNAKNIDAKVLLFHGASDNETGWEYSQEFADAMQVSGANVDFYLIENAGHSIDITGDGTASYVVRFLDELGLPTPIYEPEFSENLEEENHGNLKTPNIQPKS